MVLKEFKVNILMLFWGKVDFIREMSAILLTASKIFYVVMELDVYEPIWFHLGMMKDASKVDVLILASGNLTLIQGHRDVQLLHIVILQSSPLIWMQLRLLLRLVLVILSN